MASSSGKLRRQSKSKSSDNSQKQNVSPDVLNSILSLGEICAMPESNQMSLHYVVDKSAVPSSSKNLEREPSSLFAGAWKEAECIQTKLQDGLTELTAKLQNASREKNERDANVESLQARNYWLERDLERLSNEIKMTLDAESEDKKNLGKIIEQSKMNTEEAAVEIKSLTKKLSKKRKECAGKQAKIGEFQNQATSLQAKLEAKDVELEEISRATHGLKADLEEKLSQPTTLNLLMARHVKTNPELKPSPEMQELVAEILQNAENSGDKEKVEFAAKLNSEIKGAARTSGKSPPRSGIK